MSNSKTARIQRPTLKPISSFPPGLLRFFPLESEGYFNHPLEEGTTLLGRGDDCQIVVEDTAVSRVHARIERAGNHVRIVDCDSANGVIVNAIQVNSRVLTQGDVVRLGNTFFCFRNPGYGAKTGNLRVHPEAMVSGPSLDGLRNLIARAACNNLNVLVLGETGTGKDLVATEIHKQGDRRSKPFVAVNCAAIPSTIIESELFGHLRGAYTGATSDSLGLVREASLGTLFLDEIGELALPLQSKLLRVLQEKRVRPVGGTRAVDVDVRVVCATNQDLRAGVGTGKFRPDLFARIAELILELPPLRERIEDVPLLATYFLKQHCPRPCSLSPSCVEVLCAAPWPLNVRGLEGTIRRAVLSHDVGVLEAVHLAGDPLAHPSETPRVPSSKSPSAAHAEQLEASLLALLREHRGKVQEVASRLGLSRSQVYRRIKLLGLDISTFRS